MSEKIKARKKAETDVLFIASSDWHLSLNKPLARAETNWPMYQQKVLKQLRQLQNAHQCPIFVAGDVFDRWDSTATLINHTLEYMPMDKNERDDDIACVYGIPGNHDLPHHNYKEIQRSAYWTLVEAGKLKNLTPPGGRYFESLTGAPFRIHPFPCGFDVKPIEKEDDLVLDVALIHDFIWTEKTGYEGADQCKRYGKWIPKLKGYDIAIFGDNHKGFLIQTEDKVSILNCGTLMARKATEKDYRPSVGLVYANGKIVRHYLDISEDQWDDKTHTIAKIEQTLKVDLDGFVDQLRLAKNSGCDWPATVSSYCKTNKINKEVATIMVKAVEGDAE